MGRRTFHEAKGMQTVTCYYFSDVCTLKLTDITNNPPIPLFSLNNRRLPSSSTEDVTVDSRDIDKVLSELAGMIGRWRLFRKFITESLKVGCHHSSLTY